MKFEVSVKPAFRFTLTAAQLEVLMLASKSHYDHDCRNASKPQDPPGDGAYRESDPDYRLLCKWAAQPQPAVYQASFRQLDLCLKILENRYHLPLAQQKLALDMTLNFVECLRQWNSVRPSWEFNTTAS